MKRTDICLLVVTAHGDVRGPSVIEERLASTGNQGQVRHVLDLGGALTGPQPDSGGGQAPKPPFRS